MKDLTDILQEILGYNYRLERELPGGGMSRLFLATERSLDRRVVVKVLPPELVCDAMVARFKREVEVTAGLLHPHVLPVLTAGARDDILYYVMPYVEGESLRHRLNREGRLPMEDALLILAEVADALAFAHARGVVHRDIKPENILLSAGSPAGGGVAHALLADFGIARAIRDDEPALQAITTPGLPLGTYGYAPPEQVRGDRPADARADVYALAVVGYEMLTGEMPPAHPEEPAPRRRGLLPALGPRSSMRVAVIRRETPIPVSRAIMRALSAAPEDRFQTAAEFRDALREPYSRQVARRRRVQRVASAATLALAATVTAFWAISRPRVDPDLVVVSPFDAADPELRTWREGMADVLSRNFDGAGPLRTVPARVVIRRWDGAGDDSSAVQLGRELGAGLVICGALRRLGGDSVRIDAALLERTLLGTRTLERVELKGVESRIAPLADSVTVRFLGALGQRRALRAAGRQPLLGAGSILALKEFLRGEQMFRRNQYDSARVAYEAALRADGAFALAHWRMRATLRALRDEFDDSSYVFARTAGRLNHGLSQRDSLLVLADSLLAAAPALAAPAGMLGYQRRRIDVLEHAAKLYPDDAEVLTELGEARLHYGVRFGHSWERALDAFNLAVRSDSAYAPAYWHLVQLRGTLFGPAGAAAAVAAWRRHVSDDSRALVLDEIVRTGHADSASLTPERISYEDLTDVATIIWRWATPGDAPVAVARARMLHLRDTTRARRWYVRSLALHGRLARLAAEGRDGDWERSQHVAVFAGLAGALPAPTVDSLAARWLRTGEPDGLHASLAWWLQRRDTASLAAAARRAAEMERVAPDGADARYLSTAARAYLALASGDPATARARLDQLPDTLCRWWCESDRITRARLAEAAGDVRAAERLLSARPPLWDAVRAGEVTWFLARGRLNERAGRREEALAAYDYVARAWARADAPLRDSARVAATAAARLRAAR